MCVYLRLCGLGDLWGYYSEDGLGAYEYLLFLEKLVDANGQPTRSVWVVNNGIAHTDSIPPADIDAWVQDALDSIEFISGPSDSEWGSRRAAMGHPAPFRLDYLAIGNEDCGKPYYTENYLAFYKAIQSAYPHLSLISNCDPTQFSAPVQYWDYHIYVSADEFTADETYFDSLSRQIYAQIYVSEYGVHGQEGQGNLYAGLATAVYMNGMERNADLVRMADYAPALRNTELALPNRWDLVLFDHQQSYATPVYYNQQMYSQSYTQTQPHTLVTLAHALNNTLNVSVSVTMAALNASASRIYQGANTVYICKIVNYAQNAVSLFTQLLHLPSSALLINTADWIVMSYPDPWAFNSYEQPHLIVPKVGTLAIPGPNVTINLAQYSINVIRIYAIL